MIVLAFAMMPFAAVYAQKDGGRGNGEQMVKKLTKELTLTADQQEKLKALFASEKEKATALKTADKATRKTQMEALRSENESQMKSILTADQYTKYIALRKEREEKRHERQMERIGK